MAAYEYSGYISDKLREIIHAQQFDRESFKKRKLKFSQAFCLLWQNTESGDVPGRQGSGILLDCAACAVLMDLYALGKVDFETESRYWLGIRRDLLYVKVVDAVPTQTYLDDALFSDLIDFDQRSIRSGKTRLVMDWLVTAAYKRVNCATVALDSLVESGILDMEPTLFGRKYPLVESGPKTELVEEIRMVSLYGNKPDGYLWSLLKLLRFVDSWFIGNSPMLKQYFGKMEYEMAKQKISELVAVKESNENPKKDFDNLCDLEAVAV